MDFKGLAWIGNVYNKFENMCEEMEEAMYQDTVKYVETQVQTVNENVKRFYSEILQNFKKETYVDPVKVAAGELTLNPYAHPEMKRIANAKKEPRETYEKSVDESSVISGKTKTGLHKRPIARRKGCSSMAHTPTTHAASSAFSGTLNNFPNTARGRGTQEVNPCKLYEPLSFDSVVEEPVSARERGRQEAMEKSSMPVVADGGGSISHEPVVSPTIGMNLAVESQGPEGSNSRSTVIACSSESSTSGEGTCTVMKVASPSSQILAIDADTNDCDSMEKVLISQRERLDDSGEDVAKESDPTDSDMEIIEHLNESLVEETCILVEETGNIQFATQPNSKHVSYKKKLKAAFSGKKRSTRKEYEQLALKYKDQDFNEEDAGGYVLAPSADEKMKISPSHPPPPESEWELL